MSTLQITVSAHGPAPMHEVRFAESVVAPEDGASLAVVALLHLAVCQLNMDCDQPGSVIAVIADGRVVRQIHGDDLRELGRRTREGVTKVISQWWGETKHRDLV